MSDVSLDAASTPLLALTYQPTVVSSKTYFYKKYQKTKSLRKRVSRKLRKAGQPTKYHPRYCKMLLEYFKSFKPTRLVNLFEEKTQYSDGSVKTKVEQEEKPNFWPSIERFCINHDITITTAYNWAKKHPEFFNAVDQCKKMQLVYLQEMTLAGLAQPTFAMFVAKCNFGMRDPAPVEKPAAPVINNQNILINQQSIKPEEINDELRAELDRGHEILKRRRVI